LEETHNRLNIMRTQQWCFRSGIGKAFGEQKMRTIAWLDERSLEVGECRRRHFMGPLTADELYMALKKPVISGEGERTRMTGHDRYKYS
jgi:hypothetical protein